MPAARSPLGARIHVTGNSCSGKSTLGRRLAEVLGVPFVEIDALNWQPGWVGLATEDPPELERQLREATRGDGWVVAGEYMRFSRPAFWPRLETVVWLDLPLGLLLRRVLARSWRRWRTSELLWGTNRERFWPQLAVWRGDDSLVYWIVTQQRRKRHRMLALARDPHFAHLRFVRLTSPQRVEAFTKAIEDRRVPLPH